MKITAPPRLAALQSNQRQLPFAANPQNTCAGALQRQMFYLPQCRSAVRLCCVVLLCGYSAPLYPHTPYKSD
ncbi:MAG: hypothetical protein PHG02_08005 [Oscillospiraceae bacterium]|nr:hypothetical protein [Oscillospiraceae bacterium]